MIFVSNVGDSRMIFWQNHRFNYWKKNEIMV